MAPVLRTSPLTSTPRSAHQFFASLKLVAPGGRHFQGSGPSDLALEVDSPRRLLTLASLASQSSLRSSWLRRQVVSPTAPVLRISPFGSTPPVTHLGPDGAEGGPRATTRVDILRGGGVMRAPW